MADNTNLLDFLDEGKIATMPTGGEFFVSGLIGKGKAGTFYTFMSQTNSDDLEGAPKPTMKRKAGESWFVYYADNQSLGQTLYDLLGGDPQYKPRQVWSVLMERASVLNVDTAKLEEKFPPVIVYDTDVNGYRSNKGRHKFHMFALPFAVTAAAKLLGYDILPFEARAIKDLEIKVNNLAGDYVGQGMDKDAARVKAQFEVFTDETQVDLIGGERNPYKDSKLWQERAATWASLGESNPEAFQLIGSEKYATTSDKLNNCLKVVLAQWKSPKYVRMSTVTDPSLANIIEGKDGGPSKLGILNVLHTIYRTEQDAQKDAKDELARKENRATNGNGNGHSNVPAVPAQWVADDLDATQWPGAVAEIRSKYAEKPAAAVLNKLSKTYAATPEELSAIWN